MQAAAERPPGPLDRLLRVLPIGGQCMRRAAIVKATGLDKDYVGRKMRVLVAMKLAASRVKGCYWLTDDGRALRDAGLIIGKNRNRRNGTDLLMDRLWSAIRIERKFSRTTLLTLAVKDTDKNPADYAQSWLKRLENAGVIVRLPKLRNVETRWRLAYDLGDQPPSWSHTHKALWDWNAGRLVSHSIEAMRLESAGTEEAA